MVITIGILGAFLLNSWNEGRKTNSATRDALVNVLEDLRQDSIQFQYHVKNSERIASNLRKTITNLLERKSDDSLEYFYQRSRGYLVAVVHNGAFQSMNEQGLISNVDDVELRIDLMRYFNFVQPNVVELHEFEYERLQVTMYDIDTDEAIDMSMVNTENLELDYTIVRNVLLQPSNFRKLYLYRETQDFLKQRSEVSVDVNSRLMSDLRSYLGE